MNRVIKAFLFFCLINTSAYSQTGQPLIKNFAPYEYNGGGQIWDIIQDDRGVMYFGGNDGVYEYDGSNWTKIEFDKRKAVRAFAKDENGKIYVGSVGDFGYLSPDPQGKLKYVSLLNLVDSADRFFTDIWKAFSVDKTIYFRSSKSIFRYNPEANPKIKVINLEKRFNINHVAGKTIMTIAGEGLALFEADTVKQLNLPKKIFAYIVLPYEEDKFLLFTYRNGILIYNPNAESEEEMFVKGPFLDEKEIIKTEQILQENQIYSSVQLSGGNYAVGTIINGIYILDKKGKIINHINKEKGLLSQTVHLMYNDDKGHLWAGLTYGISYLEIQSPFEVLNERNGIKGSIYNAIRYKEKLYVNSNLGIYYYNGNKFNGVENLHEHGLQVFNPTIIKDEKDNKHLIASTITGIHVIDSTSSKQINNVVPSSIIVSENDSSKLYVTSDFSLITFSLKNEKFTSPDTLKNFENVPIIIGQENNFLWMLKDKDLIKFNLANNDIETFEKNTELVGIEFKETEKIGSKIIFVTDKGLFEYSSNKFVKISHPLNDIKNINLSGLMFKGNKLFSVFERNKKILIGITKNNETDTIPFKRLSEFEDIYPESEDLAWIISPNAVFKFNLDFKKDYKHKSPCVIRKVSIGKDSVIFYGTGYEIKNSDTTIVNSQNVRFNLKIDYNFNNLKFNFSLTDYEGSENNQYSCKLIGASDETWSAWSNINTKEYTNLYEGEYVFQVKAKNIYGVESDISEFKFTIVPPFYRTALAYVIYILLSGLIIYILIKLNARRLEAENKRLDTIVKERTAEITQQKEEIMTQAENLRDVNEALSRKNEEINQQNEEIRTIADNLQDANDEIKQVNTKLSERNKHITDSINYAKRIQQAILSEHSNINNIIPENFILLKAKETVSGDFYWYNQIGNYFVFAAVDCTGHGVPGAFMSMLGYAYLNELISKKEITNPSQVLNLLRENIIKTLHQENTNFSRDGMDIALCCVNTKTKELEYSGAHNPLYIIRNEELTEADIKKIMQDKDAKIHNDKLIEVKADRMPIGYSRKMISFKNHKLQLNEGDIVYLFSDGFPDQTGGINERKYMMKNFREFILKISTNSMAKQKELFYTELETWRNNNLQMDDVLVMGFKF